MYESLTVFVCARVEKGGANGYKKNYRKEKGREREVGGEKRQAYATMKSTNEQL